MQNLRDIDIKETIKKLGLKVDPNDNRQYKDDGYRISITEQKWYDHEGQKGGGGSIDLVKYILDCDYIASVEFLSNGYSVTHSSKQSKDDTRTASIIPVEYVKNLDSVKSYLIDKRCINEHLINWCIDHQLIYSDRYSNCIFKYGAGVEMRGIYKKWRSSRGKKTRPFCILHNRGKVQGLAITESAIDALSYRQLYPSCFVASIAGNGNKELMQSCIDIAKRYSVPIISAFDNDKGGELADKLLINIANENSVDVIQNRPQKKDWNDILKDA